MKMFPIARKRITINFILSRIKVPFEEHKHESCQMIICSDWASNISFANVSTGIGDEVFFNGFYLANPCRKTFFIVTKLIKSCTTAVNLRKFYCQTKNLFV